MTTCHTPDIVQTYEHGTEQRSWETQNRDHGRDRKNGCECDCAWVCWGGVSRRRLLVPILTTRAPWIPQLSWPWQTSCDGKTLFSLLRHLGFIVLFFKEVREHVWWVLVHWNVAHLIHVCKRCWTMLLCCDASWRCPSTRRGSCAL